MGRQPCCEKIGLKKGPWTADEDKKLRDFINTNGTAYSWKAVPKLAELLRCGKSCRLRWANYLRPNIKNDRLSEEHVERVIFLHSIVGNSWSQIAAHLPGRTDNYIKNYWNNHIKKLLTQRGIDHVTHKPLLAQPPPVADRRNHKSRKRTGKSREEIKDQKIAVETPLVENSTISDHNNNNNNNDLALRHKWPDAMPLCNNNDMGMENLMIDADFSVEEIQVINPQEILTIPQLSVDDIPSDYNCFSPSASTQLTPSTREAINCIAHGFQHLHCHNNHVQCRNYVENPGCSYPNNVDDLDYWLDSLTRDFDIHKIDPKMFQPPPGHDASSSAVSNHGGLG